MDINQGKADFREALEMLPEELIITAVELCRRHLATLTKAIPFLIVKLRPHVLSAMMEMSAGLIDRKELEPEARDVFIDYLRAHGHSDMADTLLNASSETLKTSDDARPQT